MTPAAPPVAVESTVWIRARAGARRIVASEHFVVYLTVAYFLALLPWVPRLASAENLANLLSNFWPLLAVATGQTVVLIIAGIDLSQTAIMAMASVVGGMLMTTRLDPLLFEKTPLWGVILSAEGGPLSESALVVPVGVLAMLLVGLVIGLINGAAVARLGIPAFMATLVSMMFFGALAISLTKSENISYLPDAFVALGLEGIGPVPWAMLVSGGLALGTHLLLRRTVWGHWLHALGASPRVALVSGVPTRRMILFAYAFSGVCAAVASVLYSARLEAGRPTLGQGMLLDIVGAVVIGGTSLFGGKGKLLWTVYGVLFFVLLSNTINLLNLSFFTANIVKGCVILGAAVLDVVRTRMDPG